ncbi:MAG: lytic murein transglycosylase B [Gammaproteobacteria bacterium]|nr:lytic murein transglycosylase B [Gammaproteobacteria bacterium]
MAMLATAFGLLWQGAALAEGYVERDDVRAYLDSVASRYGFDRDWLTSVIADASHQESIIAAISRPAERALAWHEYRNIFITERRIAGGVQFWDGNQAALDAAAARYNVPPHIVVAIIGVETNYGGNTGSYRVLDALTTLGFDYPRRAEFFRGQLTEFLLLVREEGMDAGALKGSYAGAMGLGQFIPSSYRTFAVDFDDDGTRDIWNNRTDAIGSVANYFAEHRWKGAPVIAFQVDSPPANATELVDSGLKPTRTAGDLRALGIAVPAKVSDDEPASLHRFEAADGIQYWVGLGDFYVITRYNHSRMYALAVFELAEAIRERREGSKAGT